MSIFFPPILFCFCGPFLLSHVRVCCRASTTVCILYCIAVAQAQHCSFSPSYFLPGIYTHTIDTCVSDMHAASGLPGLVFTRMSTGVYAVVGCQSANRNRRSCTSLSDSFAFCYILHRERAAARGAKRLVNEYITVIYSSLRNIYTRYQGIPHQIPEIPAVRATGDRRSNGIYINGSLTKKRQGLGCTNLQVEY